MSPRKLLIISTLFYSALGTFHWFSRGDLNRQLKSRLESHGGVEAFMLPPSSSFDAIPQDPKNPLTVEKVRLGKLLFHETALGSKPLIENGALFKTYSCSSCHHVAAGFQTGARQAIADGGSGFGRRGESRTKHPAYRIREMDVQMRKTPSVLNSAFQSVMFWDGQFGANDLNVGTEQEWKEGTPMHVNRLGFDGVESQAIAGFEVHRLSLGKNFFKQYPRYRLLFDAAFPELEDSARYSDQTAALAIAAYERTLIPNRAPFQKWLQGKKSALSKKEKKGALLFFGKAGCANCHSGPALNSNSFHALGMGELKGENTYQTRGFKSERLGRGGFTKRKEDMYKFKTPQLYNLADASFFGHGATFNSIKGVIKYKNEAKAQSSEIHADQLSSFFKPLGLNKDEISLLTLFITRSLYDKNLRRYVPKSVPSGTMFPVSDEESLRTSRLMGQ